MATADKDAGAFRRMLGTIVGLALAGSAFGLFGALIHPEKANPPS
jgi:hypothetical protein